jgi:uncharacterized membrane protein
MPSFPVAANPGSARTSLSAGAAAATASGAAAAAAAGRGNHAAAVGSKRAYGSRFADAGQPSVKAGRYSAGSAAAQRDIDRRFGDAFGQDLFQRYDMSRPGSG